MARKCTHILILCILPLLLTLMALEPLAAIVLLPPAAALLLYAHLRFHWGLPAAVLAAYAVTALWLHPNAVAVLSVAGLTAAFVALVFAVRCKTPLFALLLPILLVTAALVAATGILSAARRVSPQQLAEQYAEYTDSFLLDGIASLYYEGLDDESLHSPRLGKGDEGYRAETRLYLATAVRQEADESLYWMLTGYGFTAGVIAIFAGNGFLRFLSTDEKGLHAPMAGKAFRLCTLRLPRSYLWVVFLPVLVFMLLGFVEGMRPVTRAVFNYLVLLPCAVNAFTLLLHTSLRFRGAGRALAYTFVGLATAACLVFYNVGVAILAFVGIADVVLHVRKLLDWALQ